jgi:hypothetical protein
VLLILACTKVENTWQQHMLEASAPPANGREYRTPDYVRLLGPLYLADQDLTLKPYPAIAALRSIQEWDAARPTQSLPKR